MFDELVEGVKLVCSVIFDLMEKGYMIVVVWNSFEMLVVMLCVFYMVLSCM